MAPVRLGVTNGTIFDPKYAIVFIPEVVLGTGEAMRRREFIGFLGGTVAAWPYPACAQQANRPNHFTVFEVWANRKALDTHATAAHTRVFREKVSPMAGALYDERFYKALD